MQRKRVGTTMGVRTKVRVEMNMKADRKEGLAHTKLLHIFGQLK